MTSGPKPLPTRSTRARTERRALLGLVAALAVLAGTPSRGAAAGFDLAALTALLARVKAGEATFTETRRVEMLDRTLESAGRLSFRAPDVFVRETLRPRRE